MSANLLHLPSDLSELVRAQEVFDTSFEAGEFSAIDARACSTIGIARFLKDAHGLDMSQDQFFEEIPATQVRVGKRLSRRMQLVHAPEAAGLIKLNRVFGGGAAAEKDLLHSEHPDFVEYLSLVALGLPDLSAINSAEPKGAERAAISWLGRGVITDLVDRASRCGGVQVIYGGEDFDQYIRVYSKPDDNHEAARKLEKRRMPAEFFRAIIPLGEFEQGVLL